MGKIVAVVNPYSGGWKRYPGGTTAAGRAALLSDWLADGQGEELLIRETCAPGDGTKQAKLALAEGHEILVAVGGDGTVREVAQALVREQRGKLALLPIGTVNVLARALAIPLNNPATAGRILLQGRERRLDVGRCEEAYFMLMAGIGLDGAVVQGIDARWKRRLGGASYLLRALRLSLRLPKQAVTLTVDEGVPQRYDAYQVLIANTAEYGGSLPLGSMVKPDDGLLDIFVCRRRVPLVGALLGDLSRLARGRFAETGAVHHFQARRVQVAGEGRLPVQLDGDSAGHTPVTVTCVPAALTVYGPGH